MRRLLLSLISAAFVAVCGMTATASASTIVNPVFTATKGFGVGDVLIPPQMNGYEYSVGRKFHSHESFKDTISFSIGSTTDMVLKVLTWGSISWNLTLKDGKTNAVIDSTSFGSGSLRGHTGTLVTELLSLNKVGTWILTFSGTACSCAGYVISLTATPIPASLVMLMTALVGLGGFGWLRRSGRFAAGSAAA